MHGLVELKNNVNKGLIYDPSRSRVELGMEGGRVGLRTEGGGGGCYTYYRYSI